MLLSLVKKKARKNTQTHTHTHTHTNTNTHSHTHKEQNKQKQQHHTIAPVYITGGDAIALNDKQIRPTSLALLSP